MAVRELGGRRVLITGAASGIGRACAHAFAREGANLVLADVNQQALEAVRQEVAQPGRDCLALACDVSDEDKVESFVRQVLDQTGGVDVLINNAGVGYLGSFIDTPASQWRRIMDINVLSMANLTRALLPSMLGDRRSKAIVNVSSALGFSPGARLSAYCASKHAVVGLSEVLAMELEGTNIAVTIVAPGVINTPIKNSPRGKSVSDEQAARLQDFYTSEGSSPESVARDIVGAVKSGTILLKTGKFASLMCGLTRLSRPLGRRMAMMNSRKIGFVD